MTTTLYETDFYRWTLRQADLLRHEDYAELDRDNLIEEIESMGKSEQRELDSRLTTIMEHMLKLVCEPDSPAARGWIHTILIQRTDLKKLLKNNASLRAQIDSYIDDAYQDARLLAASTTACPISAFSDICPWTGGELLDINFLP